jgi:hypothetical protein
MASGPACKSPKKTMRKKKINPVVIPESDITEEGSYGERNKKLPHSGPSATL